MAKISKGESLKMGEHVELAMTGDERLEGALSFLVSRSKSSARTLSPNISDILNGCAEQIGTLVCNIVETRNLAEYRQEFDRSFPKYFSLMLAMSHIANAAIPRESIERLSRESICEVEADFRAKEAAEAFGEAVRSQVLFTVWTLRKINDLVDQINATKVEPSKTNADREKCFMFTYYLFRGQFSLDCFNFALAQRKAIYPEVVDQMIDGLRGMVNAYAHAREGLELRVPTEEPRCDVPSLDDEDNALLNASLDNAGELAAD
ncbi:MAG: hypothetical protein ACRD20_14235 [Terriglobales bacterium]